MNKIKIIKENDGRVYFSNGDQIYRGYGLYKNRWLIDSKKRRERAKKFLKNNSGHGVVVTSWFLKAFSKEKAIKEYQYLKNSEKETKYEIKKFS